MRRGKVFYKDEFAGIVIEDDNGVSFTYDKDYLKKRKCKTSKLDNAAKRRTIYRQSYASFL